MTDDELLAAMADPAEYTVRLERISAEIDAGFGLLSARVGKAVAVFGSARPGSGDPRYAVARTMGARFRPETHVRPVRLGLRRPSRRVRNPG
ncbi:hypothetical protein [Arthrobacter sp. Y81]|uniref:hypothetical protein n=1 Tax=Arthrobacter sp. Y81 TaxID=2058897 RepID=UPI0015E281D4|nr:hypothetical protein [Arthrobacter sp. Y81]